MSVRRDQDDLTEKHTVHEASPLHDESTISRRALLAGTAALAAVGVATSATSGQAAHHETKSAKNGSARDALVRTAGDCLVTGELCQAHCQAMLAQGDTRLADCSASVSDMMASCSALMQLAAADSQYLPAMASLCNEILENCKTVCDKHAKHAVCKACADACEACIQECKKVMA
ncbi:MAG: four-helix bundle copper-binding protein [Myxococcota bacterium]|nr:four-helix bundle copper-binding protein [Myxococcota bacterium]